MPFTRQNWGQDQPIVPPPPVSMPASPQQQSPLFNTLPIEVRRRVYAQLWLDCGLAQHILAVTPKSHLQSYPCILSPAQLGQEPVPLAPRDADGDDAGAAGQPQPHDDPGDIDGALQELGSAPDGEGPGTPWCAHYACFRRWTKKWDHSFTRMYTAAYVSHPAPDDVRSSPVLTAFLICKRVYEEASESLYSSVRFSFASMTAVKVFTGQVPQPLVSRIQFIDIVAADLGFLSDKGPVDDRTAAQWAYETLKASFPNIRDLRLTLHPYHGLGSNVLPGRRDLEPLYALAREAGGSLRRFEVLLPTRCGPRSELGYGDVPPSLADAPFAVKIVPPGWHEVSDCAPFNCPVRPSQT